MIEIKNLSKSFGRKKVLDGFSLKINDGEHIAIVSPSGSGKTTLFRIIAGLDKRFSGTCNVEGKISYMFQEDRLFPNSTVLENILAVTSDKALAEELLAKVELSDAQSLFPDTLSGGMKRRVALVRALAANFDILLIDEPFTGLDEELKRRVAEKVKELTLNKTLVVITHDRAEAKLLDCKIISLI